MRGASFGLRQSLDTVGAFLGPLVAIALMWLTADSFTLVFWVAVVPAFIAVTVIVFTVKEPPQQDTRPISTLAHFSRVSALGHAFWLVVVVATIFAFARFSEAFLVLRAEFVGLPTMLIPAVLVVMNSAYSLSAFPVGLLSDRLDRITILVVGLAVLVAADLVLAVAAGVVALAIGWPCGNCT